MLIEDKIMIDSGSLSLRSVTDAIPMFQRSLAIDLPMLGIVIISLMDWSLVILLQVRICQSKVENLSEPF
jgi:hypothetical protein